MLIPCRPIPFDLTAIQATAKLVQLLREPAYVVFTASSPNAPRVYVEGGELVDTYGSPPCRLSCSTAPPMPRQRRGAQRTRDRTGGQGGRGGRQSYEWACRQVGLSVTKLRGKAA